MSFLNFPASLRDFKFFSSAIQKTVVKKNAHLLTLTTENFPKLRCFHENCPGHRQQFGLGGQHSICREIINSAEVFCRLAKHGRFFDILDGSVTRVQLSKNTFYSEESQRLVGEVNDVLWRYVCLMADGF